MLSDQSVISSSSCAAPLNGLLSGQCHFFYLFRSDSIGHRDWKAVDVQGPGGSKIILKVIRTSYPEFPVRTVVVAYKVGTGPTKKRCRGLMERVQVEVIRECSKWCSLSASDVAIEAHKLASRLLGW